MRDEFVYSYPDVEEGFEYEKTWCLIDKLWPATSKCRNRNGIRDSVEKLLHAALSDRLKFSPHSFVTFILNSSLSNIITSRDFFW